MKTLSSPRRMQSIPLGRPLRYKEVRGTSARGHFTLRALHPSRKRSVPLAAPRPVDTQDHAWEKRTWSREHWRPCRCSPPVQERRPMHVLYPGDENEKCRVEPVVAHPAPPQTRTCAIHAYGSSSKAAAARARIPLLHSPLACRGQGW